MKVLKITYAKNVTYLNATLVKDAREKFLAIGATAVAPIEVSSMPHNGVILGFADCYDLVTMGRYDYSVFENK